MPQEFNWVRATAICALLLAQACSEPATSPQPTEPTPDFAKVKPLSATELVGPAEWGEGPMRVAAVSDKGQVVGTFAPASGSPSRGWSWENGRFTDLGEFRPTDVNDKGQMIGYSPGAGSVLWDDGVLTPLPGGGSALNNVGHVAGTLPSNGHPYLWRDGVTTDLGSMRPNFPPSMLDISGVVDLNDGDQVLGVAGLGYYYDQFRGFLWSEGGWVPLGTAAPGNYGMSLPTSINNSGQVVGSATAADGSGLPFLWEAGVMTTIGSRPGLHEATGINDEGIVFGKCLEAGSPIERLFPCLYHLGDLSELEMATPGYVITVGLSPNGKFFVGTVQSYPGYDRAVLWAH